MTSYRRVDEERLDRDVDYRVTFLSDFLEFDDRARKQIHAICPLLVSRLPGLVDAIYAKMLEFDATRRHLTAPHSGYTGNVPGSVEEVAPGHDLIRFRKRALLSYFTELLLSDLDESSADWMDAVGRMHTTKAGSASIHVPLIQMNAMMGFIADLFFREVASLDLDADTKLHATQALSKLFWLQNDLLSRHYA